MGLEIDINSIKRFPESPAITQEEKSSHYQKPPDAGMVTELQPDFKVKSVIEKESYDMIWKAGNINNLNLLEKFITETRGFDLNLSVWIEQQRKTLNKYL